MESCSLTHKWYLYTMLFLIIVMAQGCSKDEDAIPSNGDNGILATKSIGSSGGEIETDSLFISIPPGTFNKEYRLEVSITDKEYPLTENAVTNFYQVKGIPAEFNNSIYIALKYHKILENNSFIVLGINKEQNESNPEEIIYDLLDCKDSSDYLVCQLRPFLQSSNTKSSNSGLFQQEDPILSIFSILGVSDFKQLQKPANYKFSVDCPASMDSDPLINKLQESLEFDYIIFQSLITDQYFHLHFPLIVRIVDKSRMNTKDPRAFVYNLTGRGERQPGIPADSRFIYNILNGPVDDVELDIAIGKAFFEVYQRYIYGRDPGPDWFSQAAAVWLEERFYDPLGQLDDYVPACLEGNELSPFDGLGTNNTIAAPIVKFLVEKFGEKIIYEYHQKIMAGKTDHKALGEVINDPTYDWLSGFYKDYMEGKIYGITGEKFVEGRTGQPYEYDLLIDGPTGPIADLYNDLSAKLYRFNTDKLELGDGDNAKVEFSIESTDISSANVKILIFSFSRENNEIEFITDYSGGRVMVDNLKKIIDEKQDLLALVVNTYKHAENPTNQSNILLNIRLIKTRQLNYTNFSTVLGNVTGIRTYQDGKVEKTPNTSYSFLMPVSERGSFKGETFEADWNMDQYGNPRGFVTATVTLGDDGYTLSDFELMHVEGDDFWSYIRHIKGGDIPLSESGPEVLYGKVESSEIKAKFTLIEYSVSYFKADKTLFDDSYYDDFEITSYSHFEVQFTYIE